MREDQIERFKEVFQQIAENTEKISEGIEKISNKEHNTVYEQNINLHIPQYKNIQIRIK